MGIVRDMGVRFSASLNSSGQVLHVAKTCALVGNWIMRAFSVEEVMVYPEPSIPMLLSGCQLWLPSRTSDMNMLAKFQKIPSQGGGAMVTLKWKPANALRKRSNE